MVVLPRSNTARYFRDGVEVSKDIALPGTAPGVVARYEEQREANRTAYLQSPRKRAANAARQKRYRERKRALTPKTETVEAVPTYKLTIRIRADVHKRLEAEWQKGFAKHGLNKNAWYVNRLVNGDRSK